MKNVLLFITASLLFVMNATAAAVIVLEGNYQGKNLFVQNPFAGSGVGFCVSEVMVNGQVTTDEINSNAFEVDLHNFSLKIGDKLEVKIKHKDDCKPKVLNPEVLKPKSTFDVVSISIDKEGTLKWSTKGEAGKLPYVVEQFRWNKWVKVGETDGVGTDKVNEYSFTVTTHSGKNQFRVKQVDFTGQPRLSKTVDYVSSAPEVTFAPAKVSKEITFSSETMYEIYDQYGNIVKKGYGKMVDAANLIKGVYYLSYDNKMGEFIKK